MKRAAVGRKQRNRKIIAEKIKKYTAKNRSLRNLAKLIVARVVQEPGLGLLNRFEMD